MTKRAVWRAAGSIGFFPLLLMGLGGLSLLDVLEKAVLFREFDLIAPIEAMLSGYQRIVGWVASLVEPPLRPAIGWLNETFNWGLSLHPVWRSLLVVSLIVATSVARFLSFEGIAKSERVFVVAMPAALIVGAFFGAFGAGLLSMESTWWAQGLAAGLPIGLMLFCLAAVFAMDEASSWWAPVVTGGLAGVVAFGLGAGASIIPGLSRSGGVIALGAVISALGIVALAVALAGDADDQSAPSMARLGFNLIGGFVAAGLILFADGLVQRLI